MANPIDNREKLMAELTERAAFEELGLWWDEVTDDQKQDYRDDAEKWLEFIEDSGLVIVPKEPTEEMCAALIENSGPGQFDGAKPAGWDSAISASPFVKEGRAEPRRNTKLALKINNCGRVIFQTRSFGQALFQFRNFNKSTVEFVVGPDGRQVSIPDAELYEFLSAVEIVKLS